MLYSIISIFSDFVKKTRDNFLYVLTKEKKSDIMTAYPKEKFSGKREISFKEKEMSRKRPVYHFAPKKNWMNDPNGTLYRNGSYHLFYQYNPCGAEWGNICWAHAVSRDLVNWERKGVALSPETQRGERWCFSGCAVETGEGNKIFYTSIGFEQDAVRFHASQAICDANRDFSVISRSDRRMEASMHPFPVLEWRDPFVFFFHGTPYMVLAGIAEKASVFLYTASDASLERWEYKGVLFSVDKDFVECPNVAVFGNRIVLLYTLMEDCRVHYAAGAFDGERLTVEGEGIIDCGRNCFYASNLSRTKDGGYALYGWLRESLGGASPDAEYSGCLALPRTLDFVEGRVLTSPVKEFENLEKGVLLSSAEACGIECRASTATARICFSSSENIEFELLRNERERVQATLSDGSLRVERITSLTEADSSPLFAKVNGGVLSFDIFIDGTAVEMFIGKTVALSFRFYTKAEHDALFSLRQGSVRDLKISELSPAELLGE